MNFKYIMPNLSKKELGITFNSTAERGSLKDREILLQKYNLDKLINIAEINGGYNRYNLRTVQYNDKKLGKQMYAYDLCTNKMEYCLHTEPSLGYKIATTDEYKYPYYLSKSEGQSKVIKPLLIWNNYEWIKLFAKDVLYTMEQLGKKAKIIEIHPPNRYVCNNMQDFIKGIKTFKNLLGENAPEKILVENRASDIFFWYKDFPDLRNNRFFLMSYLQDIIEFSNQLDKAGLDDSIGIVADIGQLVTMENLKGKYSSPQESITEMLIRIANELPEKYVYGMHLYGIGAEKRLQPSHEYALGCKDDISLCDWKIFFNICKKKYSHLDEFYILPEVGSVADAITSIKNIESIL